MNTSLSHSGDYRPDVDGLRAVAVLSVMMFHINKDVLPGGFIGVDVFFVISGFLITKNILNDLCSGRFSIADFYRRRVKRIAPAMLVVVLATVVAAQVLMLPEDATSVAKSTVWSLASMANFYFWLHLDTGYFAASSREIPLLHLWSLGVEEQFYILWPVLLLVGYRPEKWKRLLVAALMVSATCFALGTVLYERDPGFAYYMLPTRAGELLVGVIAAIAVLNGVERRVPPRVVSPLAALGLIALAASFAAMSEDMKFPGLPAVLPTVGAGLVIVAGHCRANWVSRLLACKPLVWVGLISYSAYLWHWPLLALFRYGYGEDGAVAGVVLFVLTLLLAWATFRYVEQPTRRSTASIATVFIRQYIAPVGFILTLAVGSIYAERLWPALQHTDYRKSLAALREQSRPAFQFDYVCQRQRMLVKDLTDPRCVVGAETGESSVLLWGDSNAAHYVGLLGSFGREAGFRIRNLEVGSCPPLLRDPEAFVEARRLSDCRESLRVLRPIIEQFQVIVISASWSSYQARSREFLDAVFDTVRQLTGAGKLVILIGKVPEVPGYDRLCQEKALRYPLVRCAAREAPLAADIAGVNSELRQFADRTANVKYYDVTPFLCPAGHCSSHSRTGEPLYFDQSHLRMNASWQLGRQILDDHGVPAPFDLIAHWQHVASRGGAGPIDNRQLLDIGV